ncbi:MAG: alcohol dehydrogenase [Streblomastix strix]|uniref:Alcohol dehydrogenase n=1 Tax=Streblomastix strix TaxID=222440 RepID=A0A5J4W4S3_9EUKA|nr:MAG: alcohol dehydrogenase [Streblomastix strix]
MDSFVFHSPTKILFGKYSIEKIGAEIKNYGVNKVLILFGGGSVKINGVYERTKKSLSDYGVADIEFWGIQPNPLVSKVREAISIAKDVENGIEGILAVGGGSVIDSAKAVGIGVKYQGDIWDIFEDVKKKPNKGLPVFTVLTISATASEMDIGAVLSNPEKKLKIGIQIGFPVISAIDPSVQFSLPWRQIMCGAVDSLSHLMEQYFSRPNESITSRQINLALQKSIIECVKKIKSNNEDYNARANFAWSVGQALFGFTKPGLSGDQNIHYIEHAMSAYNEKIAHGEGLAVISDAYYPILYKRGIASDQFEEWAQTVFGTNSVDEALKKFHDLYIFWETPLKLNDIQLNGNDIDAIVDIFDRQQKIKRPSAIWPLSKEDAKEILKAILKK